MNVNTLIDGIVRQTTILIAQLATTRGARAQLAHTANQVFLDLVGALKEQGIGSKVIADMFGLALRTYQERVRRLSESHTIRGRSLWEAVFEHIETNGPLLRAEVLRRFGHDDEEVVRGVLRDLVHSGLVFRSGRGDSVVYRAAARDELAATAGGSEEALLNLVWINVQQHAPVTVQDLAAVLAMNESTLDAALTKLLDRGVIEAAESAGHKVYSSHGCILPFDDPLGWEGAVFDHYQALVTALCTKLRMGQTHARPDDSIGGSTFGFEVWPGHPQHDEVLALLERFRQQGIELRARVAAYNERHPAPPGKKRVITYVGQNVLDESSSDNDNNDD